jgi:antimicrobial peptide system SdpA family protein
MGYRALGLTTLLSAVAAATLVAYAAHRALPDNPLRLPAEGMANTSLWIPEGWEFFTKDPQGSRIERFVRLPGGGWESAHLQRNGSRASAFGLSRAALAEGHEMADLLVSSELRESAWVECTDTDERCLDGAPVAATVVDHAPAPSLCGELGLIKRRPPPWAWARSNPEVTTHGKILRVIVQC